MMVKTFYQSFGDGVVDSRADAFGTQELHEVRPEFRLELASSISGNGGRGTKVCNPTRYEGFGDRLGSDIRDGDGFRPTSEVIDAGEKVSVSFGGR